MLLSLATPASAGRSEIATGRPFRLVAADAAGVTLEYAVPEPIFRDEPTPFGTFQRIELAGHGAMAELGRPALPSAGAGLAIPEGARPRLTWEILDRREFPGVKPLPAFEGPSQTPGAITREQGAAIDRDWYARGAPWPETLVSFTEAGHLRSHRVGQVSVCPMQYDPATGVASLLMRVRIRVDFGPAGGGSGSPGRGETGSLGPGGAGATGTGRATLQPEYAPVGEEPAWEDTYRQAFLNYESARTFRGRALPVTGFGGPGYPASPGAPATGGLDAARAGRFRPAAGDLALPAPATTNPEFRLHVGITGLYSVGYSELAAAGWPEDVPPEQIHLYEKSFNAADPAHPLIREVPILPVDTTGVSGAFDAEDSFYFYGLNFKDRFNAGQTTARFSKLHAYWLSWWPEPGVRIQPMPGWFEAPAFTTPARYVHRLRREEDLKYIYIRPVTGTPFNEFPDQETHYWLDASVYRDSLAFSTPGRDVAYPFRLRAKWQGVFAGNHYVSIWLTRLDSQCRTVTGDTLLIYKQPFATQATYIYDSGAVLPGGRLSDGCNRFKVQGNGFAQGDPNTPGSGAYFDWFEVDYGRRYVASDGTLRFTSGSATGNVEFAIRGLSEAMPLVFDITDSLTPQRVDLSGATWTDLGGRPKEFELRFRAAVPRQRTYVLYNVDAVPTLSQAVAKMPPDLGTTNVVVVPASDITTGTGADLLVIAHPSFQGELQPWITLRQSQGHKVAVVSPQQIWDQFSGGDKSVPAIREWLRWAYRHWTPPPDYVLLFGDASEDYRKDLGSSDPDWVPTMMRFGPVPGTDDRYELIGSDNWYVGSLGQTDPDYDVLPDMHLGRLPVGTVEEARGLVAKLLAYDNYSPHDAWRNRGVLVSDDFHSAPISGVGRYCYSPADRDFERGADSLVTLFATRGCFADFTLDHFRLRDVMNAAAAQLGRADTLGNCPDLTTNINYAKAQAAPAWLAACNQGCLFQIYSGHGNRFVMSTERFVEFNGSFGDPEYRTPDQLVNHGKPFIYFGIGCHLNEFENFQERESIAALGERMLLLPGRGAVASIASTGYEWLFTNYFIETYAGKILFVDHPRDKSGRPRRILGEGVDQALLRMALEGGIGYGSFLRDTFKSYCLLGDPAMPVDMAPPRLAVAVDGVPKESEAEIIPRAGENTVTITTRLSDDVDYRTSGFSIVAGDSVVPSSDYTVEPYDDSREGACRGLLVTYPHELHLDNYAIRITAADWLGRDREVRLNVRQLKVEYALRAPGSGNGRTEVTEEEIIPTDGQLEISVTSPASLAPGDFEARVNGEVGYFDWGTGATAENTWVGTSNRDFPAGRLTFEVFVKGRLFDTRQIRVEDRLLLTEVYFYPNPWQGTPPGRFIYQLAYPARGEVPLRTRVTVFSVSGRRVVSLEGPAGTGRNALSWDMRDQRGDDLANGVYLYKLAVEFPSGRKLTTIDRLVVHR